jgi:hypothetical protein
MIEVIFHFVNNLWSSSILLKNIECKAVKSGPMILERIHPILNVLTFIDDSCVDGSFNDFKGYVPVVI